MKVLSSLLFMISLSSFAQEVSIDGIASQLAANPGLNEKITSLSKKCSESLVKGTCSSSVQGTLDCSGIEAVKCSNFTAEYRGICVDWGSEARSSKEHVNSICSAYITQTTGDDISYEFASAYMSSRDEVDQRVSSINLDDFNLKIFNESISNSQTVIEKVKDRLTSEQGLENTRKYGTYSSLNECRDLFGDNLFKNLNARENFSMDLNEKTITNLTANYKQTFCNESSCETDESIKLGIGSLVAPCFSIREVAKKVNAIREGGETSYQSLGGEVTCVISGQMGAARVVEQNGGNQATQGSQQNLEGLVPLALDYDDCRSAIYAYNSFFLGVDVVGEVTAQGYTQLQGMNIESDAQTQVMQGGVEGQTASLDAQRKQLNLQKNVESGRLVLQGAQSATLLSLMLKFPTIKNASSQWCVDGSANAFGLSRGHACTIFKAIEKGGEIGSFMFPNSAMTDFLAQKSAMSLSKAVVAGIKANMFGKQAGMVEEVTQAYVDSEFANDTGVTLDPTYCETNPTTPSCLGNNRRMVNTDLDFGVGGTIGDGQIVDFGTSDVESDSLAGTSSALGTSEKIDNLNDLFSTPSGDKNDESFNSPGVASVTGKSGGGGGGGSGGGGVGGGGGGAGAGPAEKKGSVAQKLGSQTKGKYSAGSGGRTFSGGGSKSSKKTTNPFGSLVSNNGARSIANIDTDKNLIPKRFDLFEKISKKYAEVHKSDRIKVSE